MTTASARAVGRPLPAWATGVIYVLFFCSGAAALIYEVVWMRLLSFVFGNTTYAASVALAVFLGGLAGGALLYGRKADRRTDLLRLYGLLEAGAGLIALVLPALLLDVLDPVYTWVYQRGGESLLALTAARLVLSAGLLVCPTILLGGTLPVLVRFLVRSEAGMEGHIGRLYGLNTLGAVAGGFAGGFLLMPALGMRMANVSGAAIGLSVAAAAIVLHYVVGTRSAPEAEWAPAPEPPVEGAPPETAGVWLLVAFALSGFAALAYEVLWTRLLVFFFETFVYAFSAMLCVYLLGLALGSLIYSFFLAGSRRPVRWFVILEVLIGLSAAGTIPLFILLTRIQGAWAHASFWRFVEWYFIASMVIMLVPTVLIGAVFPLVCGVWARARRRVGGGVGEVYVVNTLGTVSGSLATGFLLIPAIGTRWTLFAMAGLNLLAGLMVWTALARGRWRRGLRWAAAVGAPALLVMGMNVVTDAEDLARVYEHGQRIEVEWVREGIDGTVTIDRARGRMDALFGMGEDRRLSINGVNVAGTRVDFHTTQKLQAHLGLLIHADAERVLQVGFGSGGTAYSASLHPVDRIDCVEISRSVIEAAPRFEETNHGVLRDPRVHLYIEDARSFVSHTPHEYDVILSDSTHPVLAGEGLLYSVDYLRDCAARLRPGGVFSTWLPVYSLRPEDAKVMVRSIRAAFPYVYIWHTSIGRNEWCIVHGLNQPLSLEYESFAAEAAVPDVRRDLEQIGLDEPEDVLALLLYDHEAVDRWLGEEGPVNTDDNGYLEFVGPRVAHQFPKPRQIHAMFTFPDLVLNAAGSPLEYVSGREGAPWRERLRRRFEANRHVLYGRLYELARQDSYDLRALTEYRRALALDPGNFVARTMLGIEPGQLTVTRAAAERPETALMALDQLAAAALEMDRLADAARYADRMAGHDPPEPGPGVIVALLRRRPDEVRGLLERSYAGQESAALVLGVPSQQIARAAELARRAQRRSRAVLHSELGRLYESMAGAMLAQARFAAKGSVTLRMRQFRLRAIAELYERACDRYRDALADDPADPDTAVRLARILTLLGDYDAAIRVLDRTAEQVEEGQMPAAAWGLLAQAREAQRAPFAFLEDAQRTALEVVRSAPR